MLNKELQTVIEPGDFRIMIGGIIERYKVKGNVNCKGNNAFPLPGASRFFNMFFRMINSS
jgi:hypothetical protein